MYGYALSGEVSVPEPIPPGLDEDFIADGARLAALEYRKGFH